MVLSDVPRGTFPNALSMRRRPGAAVRPLAGVDPGSSSDLSPSSPCPRSSPSVVCGRSSRTLAIHARRSDRKDLPNAGRIPAFSGPARRTAWRRPPAMPGLDAKRRLAGHGRKGNKAAGPDRARDGAFGGCRSGAGVMPTSLRTGLRALASSPLQLSAPMAGGCPTAPVDASAAAIRVAASTSFYASCEPQAAECTFQRRRDSP